MISSATNRYQHLLICGFLLLLLGPNDTLASRHSKGVLRGSTNSDHQTQKSLRGNISKNRGLKNDGDKKNGSKEKKKSSKSSSVVSPIPVPAVSSTPATLPVVVVSTTQPPTPDIVMITTTPPILVPATITTQSPAPVAEMGNVSGRIPMVPDRVWDEGTVDNTYPISDNSSSSSSNGEMTKAWDEACPIEAKTLKDCVDDTDGELEYCKTCVKAASTLSSQFALSACSEQIELCNGCQTSVEDYYECGQRNTPRFQPVSGASFAGFVSQPLPLP